MSRSSGVSTRDDIGADDAGGIRQRLRNLSGTDEASRLRRVVVRLRIVTLCPSTEERPFYLVPRNSRHLEVIPAARSCDHRQDPQEDRFVLRNGIASAKPTSGA